MVVLSSSLHLHCKSLQESLHDMIDDSTSSEMAQTICWPYNDHLPAVLQLEALNQEQADCKKPTDASINLNCLWPLMYHPQNKENIVESHQSLQCHQYVLW